MTLKGDMEVISGGKMGPKRPWVYALWLRVRQKSMCWLEIGEMG